MNEDNINEIKKHLENAKELLSANHTNFVDSARMEISYALNKINKAKNEQ